MNKREIRQKIQKARNNLSTAIVALHTTKYFLDNGAHKHVCEAIVMLTDIQRNLSPSDPHLNLE